MACATLKRSYEFDPLLTPQHQPSPKRRRCVPLTTANPSTSVPPESHFLGVAPRLSQDQVTANIHQEFKRLQRRKHLRVPCPNSPEMSSFSSCSPSSSPPRKDQPLFTLKQVSLICERMLKERETQLTEEYDKVLREKLAGLSKCNGKTKRIAIVFRELQIIDRVEEQYDAFVKFNYDQVQRRFQETAPTYVS